MNECPVAGLRWEVQPEPDRDSVEYLIEQLVAYNDQFARAENMRPLAAFAWAGAQMVGGVHGLTHWNWLFISQLWVHDQYRGVGIGSRLLGMAEEMARSRGADAAHLSTFDFQARGFYERHRYRQFGQLDEFPTRHALHFLVKQF